MNKYIYIHSFFFFCVSEVNGIYVFVIRSLKASTNRQGGVYMHCFRAQVPRREFCGRINRVVSEQQGGGGTKSEGEKALPFDKGRRNYIQNKYTCTRKSICILYTQYMCTYIYCLYSKFIRFVYVYLCVYICVSCPLCMYNLNAKGQQGK